MILKVIYALVFIAVLVLSPVFVKAQRNGACPKSLLIKMLAASGYLVTGALGIVISGNFTRFSKIMLAGLVCAWLGDLFLHLWMSKIYQGIGFLGFLSSHFCFIAAFVSVIKRISPEQSFFVWWEIAAVILFDLFFYVFSKKIGTDLKGIIKVPLLIYASVIVTMLCKAIEVSVLLLQNSSPFTVFAVMAGICLCFGALCFVASDFTIAILIFNEKHKKNYPLKMFNIVSYFVAVLLLSASILFVS